MRKIKVLHIIKSLGRGGAETLLPETIKVHNREQFEFHCIYFLPWKNQMVGELEQLGVKVICKKANNNLQIVRKASEVYQYILDNEMDIVHSHLPWAGFVARRVFKKLKRPTLYTEHNLQNRYHKITRLLNKITFNWQSLAIAVSTDVERSIHEHIHPEIPVKAVFNGVNTNHFTRNPASSRGIRERFGIREGQLVIGTLGVFRFQKRLDLWLEIFSRVQKDHSNIRGIIVGDGPLKGELEKKVADLGLAGLVHMPGLQTNAVDWFSAMDIFMMSSEFEGLPLALLEAMSTECAVVSTDAGGVKQVIRHEIDGMISEVADSAQLEKNLRTLIAETEVRSRLSRAARKRVAESYSISRMVEQLEDIYHTVIKT